MKIDILDLTREYKMYREEYVRAIESVMDEGAFILGNYVQSFEEDFAQYLGASHCSGVASGTDALRLSLIAAGVKRDDEVITTPFTFIATAETIQDIGAVPVFADIDPQTLNLDPGKIESLITDKTKAVIPVHLYGNPCDMDAIGEICRNNNLKIIEDCAQSAGALYSNKQTGSFGDFACFSFYPTKNLGCAGDGGAVISKSDGDKENIDMLRAHGSLKKYNHQIHGFNSRLDAIQAALLSVKLKNLDSKNQRRREIADIYNSTLNEAVQRPVEQDNAKSIYHQYTVRVEKRDVLREYLSGRGIGTAVHYPLPLHRQKAIKYFRKGDLKNAERYSDMVLSLPVYPELEDSEVHNVVKTINDFYD